MDMEEDIRIIKGTVVPRLTSFDLAWMQQFKVLGHLRVVQGLLIEIMVKGCKSNTFVMCEQVKVMKLAKDLDNLVSECVVVETAFSQVSKENQTEKLAKLACDSLKDSLKLEELLGICQLDSPAAFEQNKNPDSVMFKVIRRRILANQLLLEPGIRSVVYGGSSRNINKEARKAAFASLAGWEDYYYSEKEDVDGEDAIGIHYTKFPALFEKRESALGESIRKISLVAYAVFRSRYRRIIDDALLCKIHGLD